MQALISMQVIGNGIDEESVKCTYTPGVVGDLGGFGGLYSLAGHSMSDPMLVSGTDGVGTKLRLAIMMDKHDTIGARLRSHEC